MEGDRNMTAREALKNQIRALPHPKNYYRGLCVTEGFELPDEILLFYHTSCVSTPNAHYRYTLVFPLSEMTYYVDQNKYFLHEGDILFIPPYSLRFMAPKSAEYKRFLITFQLENRQPYLPDSGLYRWNDEVERHLARILESYNTGNGIALAVTLCELLQILVPDTQGQHVTEKHGLSGEIAKSLEFINDNLHTPLDIKQIASKVNMSVSNIALRFKREVGMPIHQYILHQRLEFARYYLRETQMRLDEIAQRCSFETASSFSHFFKSGTGMSPLAWRKVHQRAK